MITEIKKKITPPADNNKDNQISELEQQIKDLKNNKPTSEIVEKVKEYIQEFNADSQIAEQLKKATNYQELYKHL